MRIFNRFGKAKDRFHKQAREVTHRAVGHSTSHNPLDISEDVVVSQKEQDRTYHEKRFARAFWLTGLVVALVMLIARKTFDLLLLVLLAYVFSVGLEGPIRYVEHKTKKRGLALFLVYAVLILFCLSMLLIVPFVAQQALQMIQSLISVINNASTAISTNGFEYFVHTTQYIPSWLKDNVLAMSHDDNFVVSVRDFLDTISQTATGYLSSDLASDSFAWIRGVFGSGFVVGWQISLVIVLSVFFSLEYKDTFVFLVGLAPREYRPSVYRKMLIIYDKMQLWLKGQLFLMMYIFVVTLIGLWVLHFFGFEIPQIFVLALIAGMTEFLPYIGPMLGSLPAILVALAAGGWPAALAVMILFFVIQWTENNIVVPVVMNKVLGVRSLIIFLIMLLAASLFGFVGVVMAVPLAVIVTIFAESNEEITTDSSHNHK